MFYIGIDGGGTHSRLIGVNHLHQVLGSCRGESTNMNSNEYEVVKQNIQNLMNDFYQQTGSNPAECVGMCIGSAGIDTEDDIRKMETLFREIGIKCPVKVVNDSELLLATETKGKAGLCVIAGTGSIAFAVDEQQECHRVGGWGHLIDDGGSGYWIGMQAIKKSLMAWDGRGKQTALLEKIKEHFKIECIDQVLNIVYGSSFNKKAIAALAMIVKECAIDKDEVALEIETEAAQSLAEHILCLIRKTNMTNHTILMSGSVLTKNENIQSMFKEMILNQYNQMKMMTPTEKPEMGAIYLAMNI